jgi:hypothetical protein
MPEPRTKGIGFRTLIPILRSLRGEETVAATLARLAPALAEQLRENLFFSDQWYPLSWFAQFHAAAREVTGEGAQLSREIGFEAVRGDLRGVYSVFLLVVSPSFILGKAPKLFSTYFDTGKMTVEPIDRNNARAAWVGCAGFGDDLWNRVVGGCEAALTAGGAKGLKMVVRDGGGRSDGMLVEATWR